MRNGRATRNLETAAKRRKSKPSPIGDETTDSKNCRYPPDTQRNTSEGVQAIGKKWHPEERDHHRQERTYWRISAILTAVAAIGAVATVLLSQCSLQEARRATREAHLQAIEAKRQADTADSALKNGQRAFIIVNELQQERIGNEIFYTPLIKNSGLTSASNVDIINTGLDDIFFLENARQGTDFDFQKEIAFAEEVGSFGDPADFLSFTDHRKLPGSAIIRNISVAPGGIVRNPNIRSTLPNVDMLSSRTAPFVFGAISYKDVFDNQHVSKYCFFLNNILMTSSGNSIESNFCTHWNCADKDCEKDKENYNSDVIAYKERNNKETLLHNELKDWSMKHPQEMPPRRLLDDIGKFYFK